MKRFSKLVILFIAMGSVLWMFFSACSLHPAAWKPPHAQAFAGATALNEELTTAQIISLNGWFGAEDILFDSSGNIYTGVHKEKEDFSQGSILKIDPAGKIEVFYDAGSWVSGLHFDANGNLIALSHKEGLISISPNKKVTLLADQDEEGNRFLIPNGLDVATDGKIYFSNTSEKSAYTIRYGKRMILEMHPLGGLYCYDPATKKITTLIKGTYFGNGVVLSKDESYILLVETSRYRVIRYWLKGKQKGQKDIFIENLPGFPNGISMREDGTYWLGFTTKRNEALDNIHNKPGMKRLVYALPAFLQPKAEKFGMVMNISADGKILSSLYDTQGTTVSEAGAVKEYKEFLFMGGDLVPGIAKYKLNPAVNANANRKQSIVSSKNLK